MILIDKEIKNYVNIQNKYLNILINQLMKLINKQEIWELFIFMVIMVNNLVYQYKKIIIN